MGFFFFFFSLYVQYIIPGIIQGWFSLFLPRYEVRILLTSVALLERRNQSTRPRKNERTNERTKMEKENIFFIWKRIFDRDTGKGEHDRENYTGQLDPVS